MNLKRGMFECWTTSLTTSMPAVVRSSAARYRNVTGNGHFSRVLLNRAHVEAFSRARALANDLL